MHYCASHMQDMSNEVRRHGFWRYVNPHPDAVKGFAARWLLGRATKDEIDPLVVMMMEIGAKAIRMGLHQGAKRCPLCAIMIISKDASQPGVQIAKFMEEVIRPLMITNGRNPSRAGRRLFAPPSAASPGSAG